MQHVGWLDLAIFVTGLISVALVVWEHVATWPIGLVNSALFLVSLWRVGLYANAVLQVGFLVIGAYGWWRWSHPDPGKAEVAVTRLPRRLGVGLSVAGVVGTVVCTLILGATDDPDPFWDAATLVGSLVAQHLLAVKHVETWVIWVAVDVATVPLLLHQGLQWSALLFVAYGLLAVVGLREWRTSMRTPVDVATG